MDPYEATKVVFSRIQSIDQENASKIMGLLLIQDNGEKEMIRLAFGPENLLHSLVVKSRQELGISPNTNTPSSTTISNNINNNNNFTRQNSTSSTRLFLPNGIKIPTSLTIPTLVSPSPSSSPSWGGSVFSDFHHNSSDLLSPCSSSNSGMNNNNNNLGSTKSCPSTLNPSTPPFYCSSSSSSRGGVGLGLGGGAEFIDEIQLQEQLSFLNDSSSPTLRSKSSDLFYSQQSELLGNGCGTGDSMSLLHGGASAHHPHRRSCSVSDINLGSLLDDPSSGFGWKPCLYYAKGFCKNGSNCRFVHGGSELEASSLVGSPSKLEMMEQCHELMRSKSMQHQKLMAAIACGSTSYPYSMSKNLSLFAQHQQNDSPRAAATAMMMGEEIHKFSRSPRGLESCRGDSGSVSRQIYLTFPADSTFREEDVSSYFRLTLACI